MDTNSRIDILEHAKSAAWDNFYEVGGWGMYPTTLFGFILIVSAWLYLFRPERRFLAVAVTAGVLTISSGVVATFSGLKIGFTYVQYVEPAMAAKFAAAASADAFSNIIFALILINMAGIAILIAFVRRAKRGEP